MKLTTLLITIGLATTGACLLLTPPPASTTPTHTTNSATPCAPNTHARHLTGVKTPELTRVQLRNARTIVAVAAQRHIPRRGLELAIATALVETRLRVLASRAVPESLNYPHDGVAPGDLDSVGLMQQRPSQGWGTTVDLMNPGIAAHKFFDALTAFDYQNMEFTDAAQNVQHSAYPDRYGQHHTAATHIVDTITGEALCPTTSTQPHAPIPAGTVRDVLSFAVAQTGKDYVMGAEGPNAWDCSSLAQAAWAQAGITLPRTAQAQRDHLAAGHGTRITPGNETPGDLIFWNSYLGPHTIGHVVLVLNPTTHTTIEAHGHADGVGTFTYNGKSDWKTIFEIWRPQSAN